MHVPNTPALPQNQLAVRAELTGSDRCSAIGIEVRGAAPVLALCRKLVDAGHDPATPLEAWRGAVLCLRVRSIVAGARLTVNESRTAFVPWKPFPHAAVSPRNRVRQGVL
jgi:hypothetical protein